MDSGDQLNAAQSRVLPRLTFIECAGEQEALGLFAPEALDDDTEAAPAPPTSNAGSRRVWGLALVPALAGVAFGWWLTTTDPLTDRAAGTADVAVQTLEDQQEPRWLGLPPAPEVDPVRVDRAPDPAPKPREVVARIARPGSESPPSQRVAPVPAPTPAAPPIETPAATTGVRTADAVVSIGREMTPAPPRPIAAPSTAPPATTAAAPPVAAAAAPPVTAPVAAAAAPPAVVPPPAAPVAPASSAVRAANAIQTVLGRYTSAFNTLDARQAKAVWPNVNERNLARAFDGLAQQQFDLGTCAIQVTLPGAVATCDGTARYTPKVGNRTMRTEPRRWTFRLRAAGDDWSIESVDSR